MNILERIVFFFYNLVIAVLSVVFIVITLKLVPLNVIGGYFYALYANNFQTMLTNLLIGLIFFFISLRFIFINFQSKHEVKRTTINQVTEIGDVKIAVEALEAMATRTGGKINGVRELVAKVVPTEFGAKIALKVSLDPEINIPETTDKLQNEVKNYIETLSGVKVEKVIVVVKDVLNKPASQRSSLK